MPTRDSQQTPTTSTNQTVGVPSQEGEFDLGITTQETSNLQEQVWSQSIETQPESTGETFDFSLDLPENYASSDKENTEEKVQSSSDLKQEFREENPAESHFLTPEPQESSEKALTFSEWNLSPKPLEIPTEETRVSEETSVELLKEPTAFFSSSEKTVSEPTTVEVEETVMDNENSLGLQASDQVSGLELETKFDPRDESSLIFTEELTSWSQISSAPYPTFSQVDSEVSSGLVSEESLETPQESIEAVPVSSEWELVNSALVKPQAQESEWPKLLNLDEMISHFSGKEHIASVQATMDPFSAMKATLEAQHQEKSQSKEYYEDQATPDLISQAGLQIIQGNQEASSTPETENQIPQPWTEISPRKMKEMPIQTLNLDTMIATEQAIPSEVQTPVIQQTLMSKGPLSNSTFSYPQLSTAPKKKQRKGISILLVSVLVLLIGGVAIMRYPDLFSFSWENSPTIPIISNEKEHSSAPEQILLTGVENTELLSGNQEQDIFESLEEITLQEPPLDEEEIPLIDLSSWEETPSTSSGNFSSSSLPGIQNQNIATGSVDPLGAVESLVGPINNNDFLKQELLEYQQKGQYLKEQGSAQEKRTMMKYGLAVEKEATRLLNTLANGENITISEWSALKLKLDNYLQTANNA